MTRKEVGLCQCGSFVMFCAPNAKILTEVSEKSFTPKNPSLEQWILWSKTQPFWKKKTILGERFKGEWRITFRWRFVSSSRQSEERSEWRGQYGWDRRISRSSPLRAGALAASGVAQTHMRGLQARAYMYIYINIYIYIGVVPTNPYTVSTSLAKCGANRTGTDRGVGRKVHGKPRWLKDDSVGMILVVIGYVCVLFLTWPTEQPNNMLYIPTCVRRLYSWSECTLIFGWCFWWCLICSVCKGELLKKPLPGAQGPGKPILLQASVYSTRLREAHMPRAQFDT